MALNLPENVVISQLDVVSNWARSNSLWPMPFATACCGIELMATASSRYDLARFGAEVMLDLLDGEETERTRLRMVREKPLPFPPEPVRWAGIQLTRHSMDRADRNGGRRNLWLRAMDRLGLGFDS